MERPERPSRHSKSHDKWKRIIQPAGDSDSSTDWSSNGSDSENMRPDVRYFGGTEHVADSMVPVSNRSTFECTSVNLQPSTSASSPFQLDLRSMFPLENKRKRVDVTADTSAPSTSNNSHLLHHDYAVGDNYKPTAMETYGWPWYQRPSANPNPSNPNRKRVRFTIPSDEIVHDVTSSNADDGDSTLSTLTTRQITVASLSETLPTAAESKRSLVLTQSSSEEPVVERDPGAIYPLPLVKHRHGRYELGHVPFAAAVGDLLSARIALSLVSSRTHATRFDWNRKYSDVLHELETPLSVPGVRAAEDGGGEVQVIAMAGPSTAAASTSQLQRAASLLVRPDASEEVIIVEDQQPAPEIPTLESLAIPSMIEDRPEPAPPQHPADEEPLNQSLIGLLECPVCMEYMRPPIHQCRRGHLVCAQCKPKLQACPTCRSRLSENRNLSMEKVADKLQYPCKNSPEGCGDTLRLRDKERHEANCKFRSYRCCFTGCDWKGFRENTLPHYSVKHHDKVLYGSEQFLRIQLGDMSTSTNQNWIISALDELFRVNFITVKSQPRATLFDTGTRLQVFGCVQYIGACKRADNFKYKLESKKFDGRMWRSAIYKRATHNDIKKCIAYYSSGDSFCIRGDTAELLSERSVGETALVVRVKLQPATEVVPIV